MIRKLESLHIKTEFKEYKVALNKKCSSVKNDFTFLAQL